MFMTVEVPRKWSTRKTRSSGTMRVTSWFRALALAASVPNGFSKTSRVPGGSSMPVRAWQARSVTAGGSAK